MSIRGVRISAADAPRIMRAITRRWFRERRQREGKALVWNEELGGVVEGAPRPGSGGRHAAYGLTKAPIDFEELEDGSFVFRQPPGDVLDIDVWAMRGKAERVDGRDVTIPSKIETVPERDRKKFDDGTR